MNIYFIRHGESENNAVQRHQGAGGNLSEKGIKQAENLAKRLKNIPVDIIYSSHFQRAKQTAEIISEELKLPIEYWEEIRERKRPTELEGILSTDLKSKEIRKIMTENWLKEDWKYSDEESFSDLKKRAQKVLDHLLEKHEGQQVLCISHAVIIKMIICLAIFGEKLNPEVFWEFYSHCWMENTGITQLEYMDKYGWGMVTWNDTTHL